jgi:environmental stress-induced protein Ves
MQILRKSSFRATPWKNGGGITHEALRVPASGEPFRWRLSVAQIDASGPFSDFAGYRRHMVLLRGAGVRLCFADGTQALLREAGDSAEFDGALATRCELLGGSCVDLNLMVSVAMPDVRARVERLRAPLVLQTESGTQLVLLCVAGSALLGNEAGEHALLETGDLALLAKAGEQVTCRGRNSSPLMFVARLTDG